MALEWELGCRGFCLLSVVLSSSGSASQWQHASNNKTWTTTYQDAVFSLPTQLEEAIDVNDV